MSIAESVITFAPMVIIFLMGVFFAVCEAKASDKLRECRRTIETLRREKDPDGKIERFERTLRKALDVCGYEHQCYVLFEEMAELQNSLCKRFRKRGSDKEVVSEIADVMIMCAQMAMYFGYDKVSDEIDAKVRRLGYRLQNDREKL